MTSVTLVRQIRARPSIVFDALTTAAGISLWWGPDEAPVLVAEADPRVGGAYRVRFRTLDGLEHEAAGEFLELAPPKRLVMSLRWTDGGEPEEMGQDSRLEFDLTPMGDGVELTLTHANLKSEASRLSHTHGWTGSLDKLARVLSGSTGFGA